MQLPNFNALFLVSLLAAFMSISYSTIGWVSAVAEGKAAAVSYAILGGTTPKIMGIFNGLGTMVFAYGGHSVVLEIQVIIIIVILELQDLDDWLAFNCHIHVLACADLRKLCENIAQRVLLTYSGADMHVVMRGSVMMLL